VLAAWRESDLFGPVERLILAATEAIHEMTVTDVMFSALEAELGRAGAMELIVVSPTWPLGLGLGPVRTSKANLGLPGLPWMC
jgi:hypothetical protein